LLAAESVSILSRMWTSCATDVTSIFVMSRARCALIVCSTLPGFARYLLVHAPFGDQRHDFPFMWRQTIEAGTTTSWIMLTSSSNANSASPFLATAGMRRMISLAR
jgi:hypothetical protein